MSLEAIATIAQVVAVGVAAFAIFKSLHSIRDQLRLVVFTKYTKRYSEILADFPADSRDPMARFDAASLSSTEREQSLTPLRRYFNLCSEELFLYSNKRINDETWKVWASGIEMAMRRPYFRSAWEYLRPEHVYFHEFVEFMDGLVLSKKEP